MHKQFIYIFSFLLAFAISCHASKKNQISQWTLQLEQIENAPQSRYPNLEYGIRLSFLDDRANTNILQLHDVLLTNKPQVETYPQINQFVPTTIKQYMRTLGFNVEADAATDYIMEITIEEFHTDYLSGLGWHGTIMMNLRVLDHERKILYPATEVEGKASQNGSPTSSQLAQNVLNKAFANALKDIDWDRIAFFLHKTQNNADKTNKANSAITKAPIHWDIQSRPQGADIYWRVVSSTDEVKNQNTKYLETTPYETTEPFDIKGLTYENSEQVQIEIRCEKEGYATQKKRFNLNSILDEKELSVFFKLVKIEE